MCVHLQHIMKPKVRKTAIINVRCDQQFKEDAETFAKSVGLNISALVRTSIIEKKERHDQTKNRHPAQI